MILLSYECLIIHFICISYFSLVFVCFFVNKILGQIVKQFLSFLLLIAELFCFSNFMVPLEVNKNASLEILIGIALNLK